MRENLRLSLIGLFLMIREFTGMALCGVILLEHSYVRVVLGLTVGVIMGTGFGWYCSRWQVFGFSRPILMWIPLLPLQVASILGFFETAHIWMRHGELLFLTPWLGFAEQLLFIVLTTVNLKSLHKFKVQKPRKT